MPRLKYSTVGGKERRCPDRASRSGEAIDVYAATIPGLRFDPGVHVNYAESVLRMDDGLPKQKDYPADMGGSGTLIAA